MNAVWLKQSPWLESVSRVTRAALTAYDRRSEKLFNNNNNFPSIFFIYTIFSHIFKQRCKDSPLQTTHRSCHCDSLFYEHLPFGIEFKMSSMEIIKSVTHIRRQSVREQWDVVYKHGPQAPVCKNVLMLQSNNSWRRRCRQNWDEQQLLEEPLDPPLLISSPLFSASSSPSSAFSRISPCHPQYDAGCW